MGRTNRANIELTDDAQAELDALLDRDGDFMEDEWLDGSYEGDDLGDF